ncbi:MAG: signal recognition particle-docking protein FtsY [Pseudomonadota bacterium]
MSWFEKLKGALGKTSETISTKITDVLNKRKLGQDSLQELEDLLISSDMGVQVAQKIIEDFSKLKFEKDAEITTIKKALADIIAETISQKNHDFILAENKLNVVLVCGVNGNGKTTTIGKLAHLYSAAGKKVVIAACDTFRAAAKEQLMEWGTRANVKVITGVEKRDPASLAYEALETSMQDKADILFIDTAGRLQNHTNLMEELSKIIKVIKKLDPDAPHHTLLVIDATTGQNAFSQVKAFSEAASINGLVITKLDGTAKAGVVVGLSKSFKIPLHFIGVGEGINDLKPFNPQEFADALVGVR